MNEFTFHSAESVFRGHPDKIADQISDSIVDAYLQQDKYSKVACETLVKQNLIVVGGEVTSAIEVNIDEVVCETVKRIGYTDSSKIFNVNNLEIIKRITAQSPSFTEKIGNKQRQDVVASDQGILYGFASNESPTKMPLPMYLAQSITQEIENARVTKQLPYLQPDGKCQVTVAYSKNNQVDHVHSVVVSAQHKPEQDPENVIADIRYLLDGIFDPHLITPNTKFFINHFGKFINGGPEFDCGITGRKLLIDTYGSAARHGGGAFSGKDPSKLDRSGAYAARWIAKNIVSADLAAQCEVELVYAMGYEQPISIGIQAKGTEKVSISKIEKAVRGAFDLRPSAIVEELGLRDISSYKDLAFGGHMGRHDLTMPWESTQKASLLSKVLHGS